MELWIVGQLTDEQWACEGVFDSREKAEAICVNELFFVTRVILNEPIAPGTIITMPDAYFPKSA